MVPHYTVYGTALYGILLTDNMTVLDVTVLHAGAGPSLILMFGDRLQTVVDSVARRGEAVPVRLRVSRLVPVVRSAVVLVALAVRVSLLFHPAVRRHGAVTGLTLLNN